MDTNAQALQTSQQPVSPQSVIPDPRAPQNPTSSMPKILLITLGVIILLGLLGGAYFLGTKKNVVSYNMQTKPAVTIAPTSIENTPAVSPSPTFQSFIAGGVYTFSKYQVSFSPDWQKSESNTAAGDIVTLTKGDYQLKITQGAFDGGACSYSDKPITTGIFQTFASFIAIIDQDKNQYRRGKIDQSGLPGQDKYEVCAFSVKNNVFQEFTPFGRIDYITPVNADTATLVAMDTIIASLESQ